MRRRKEENVEVCTSIMLIMNDYKHIHHFCSDALYQASWCSALEKAKRFKSRVWRAEEEGTLVVYYSHHDQKYGSF